MNDMRICKIEGCDRKHEALGYCAKHYRRFKIYGDPLYTQFEMHGMENTTEYNSWHCMKNRCHNPNGKDYHCYGGRGIKVCDRWRNSFMAFFKDMGPKPFIRAKIDRIDNDGDYTPDNCQWVSNTENLRHTSATRLTMQKAEEIRKRYKIGKLTQKALGLVYGVSSNLIWYVVNNKTWRQKSNA